MRQHLYLTQSSIVFCAGDLKYSPDYSIGLSNIECIKTIDKELYRNGCFRSDLIIQLKIDSSEKMFMKGNIYCSYFKFEIDSVYSNGGPKH